MAKRPTVGIDKFFRATQSGKSLYDLQKARSLVKKLKTIGTNTPKVVNQIEAIVGKSGIFEAAKEIHPFVHAHNTTCTRFPNEDRLDKLTAARDL